MRHDYHIAVRARTPSGGGAGVAIPSGDKPVPGINTCGLYAPIFGCKLHEGGAAAHPGIVYIYSCGNAAPTIAVLWNCPMTGRNRTGAAFLATKTIITVERGFFIVYNET